MCEPAVILVLSPLIDGLTVHSALASTSAISFCIGIAPDPLGVRLQHHVAAPVWPVVSAQMWR